jgi:hypothetical protein
MRWALWITFALVILLAVYIASPLIALQSIASAVEARDAAALTERIEFPALRRSLTRQIVDLPKADRKDSAFGSGRQALGGLSRRPGSGSLDDGSSSS